VARQSSSGEASLAEPGVTRFVPAVSAPVSLTTSKTSPTLLHQWHRRFGSSLWPLVDRPATITNASPNDRRGLPPFYEQPFARSGKGTSWDGLSHYDLTKFTPWYWSRLRQFADLCDGRGLFCSTKIFQHNILEAGAHWADFPGVPQTTS